MGVRFFSLQLEKDGCIKASAQESYPGSGTQDDTTRLLESARKAADHLLVQMITPKQAETVDKGVTVKTYTNRFDDDGRTIKNPIVDQKGYLYVASDPPGANVVVNGEVKGQTPYQAELMVGEYVIKCESGALWIPAQKRVKMTRDGAEIRMVLGPNHGTLKVESYPDGAEISINGEPTGEKTPFTFPPKKAGEYTVTLLKKMHILKTVQVRLGEGKTTAVLERLEPNYGLLKVVSDPAGASITVDGENTGKTTPATIGPYSEGLHDVALSLPGYNDYRKKVKVERIKTEVLEVALAGKKGLIKVEAWKDVSGSRQAVRAEVRVDGKKAFTTPGKVELLLGRYEVEIDGGRDGKYSETVAITEGAEKKVVAELKGAGLGPVPGQAPPVGAERPLPRADQSTRAMKIYGLIGTFGGLALVGLGGVFTWQASAWSDSFKNASTNDRMNDARDKMNAYNGLAVAGYVVGSALAVSGIVVWAVGASKPDSRPQVSVSPGFFKDGVTVTVGGGW
jgi:hypothetical protein